MPITLLLAMQASGMITDYFGAKSEANMMKLGIKVQRAGIEANIAQLKLETEDQSLQAIKQLRQSLGSQIAIMAARGTSTAGGSSVSLLNESVNNFNTDERIRRLNALGKENQLRAGNASSILQYNSDVSKLWQGFSSRTVNRFPSNLEGWKNFYSQGREAFGLTKVGA